MSVAMFGITEPFSLSSREPSDNAQFADFGNEPSELYDCGSDANVTDVVDSHDYFDFEITSVDCDSSVPERFQEIDKIDHTMHRIYPAHTRQHKRLSVSQLSGVRGCGRPLWSVDATDVAKILPSGMLRHKAGGSVTVTATCSGKSRTRTFILNTIPAYSDVECSQVSGSMRESVVSAIDDRIAGKSPSTAKAMYSVQNHTAAEYVRSPNCWAADLDLTCISPWNSYGANLRAGTLISPRHVVWARHYTIPTGTTLRFVTNDNQVVVRTITGVQDVGTSLESDLTIGVLDSDVPDSISFAKILPANWEDYLIQEDGYVRVPVLCLDQQEHAIVADTSTIAVDLSGGAWCTMIAEPIDTVRLSFYEEIISGDSGNPCFLVCNDELVILTVWTSPDAGSAVHKYRDPINAIMASLGGDHQLTEIDLSGFVEF